MSANSADRVPRHTRQELNEAIRHTTEDNIAKYKCGDPAAIQRRLDELDREWDIERVLEMNAASLSLLGLVFAITRGRHWMLLPAAVGIFLVQHAIQGWCPPARLLRELGFRTRKEIDQERYGLKVLRGDFQNMPTDEMEKARFNMNLLYTALRR